DAFYAGDESDVAFAAEREAVANGNDAQVDTVVAVNLLVERANGACVRVVYGRVGDLATPENVINGDQSAGSGELEGCLVVAVKGLFVGIDEDKIKGILSIAAQEVLKGAKGGLDVKLDAIH